jgi:acetyltransferase-like isoleucine patch superfamily enzyme
MSHSSRRFMSSRDLLITPMVEIAILIASIVCSYAVNLFIRLDSFGWIGMTYLFIMFWTLIVLKALRRFFPLREGVFSYARDSYMCYLWNLRSFLCTANLSLFYQNSLLPVILRKPFYQLLGVKTGDGMITIAGRIAEPELITLGAEVVIGDEAFVMGHAFMITSSGDVLILGRTEIQSRALIGTRAMVLPGVVVGENSMVAADSFVAMNTVIPPNEIWGGKPAVKLRSIAVR